MRLETLQAARPRIVITCLRRRCCHRCWPSWRKRHRTCKHCEVQCLPCRRAAADSRLSLKNMYVSASLCCRLWELTFVSPQARRVLPTLCRVLAACTDDVVLEYVCRSLDALTVNGQPDRIAVRDHSLYILSTVLRCCYSTPFVFFYAVDAC